MKKSRFKRAFFAFILPLIFISCSIIQGVPSQKDTINQQPEFNEPANSSINICLGYEPESLYLYGSNSQSSRDVLAAIYDGPIDILQGEAQPVILQKMPSFSDGDATFNPVGVQPGQEIINADGQLTVLSAGVQLFPRDCRSPECVITYDGQSALQMDELVLTFTLREDIRWSDGQALSASDSVYSFALAADPQTPISKRYTEQVRSYEAIDALSVQMVSKPGLVVGDFQQYFWSPLPRHAWEQYSAAQLLSAEESMRKPLGWGPFSIVEWVQGESIHLAKNPYYFRASEGLPQIDLIHFRYFSDGADLSTLVEQSTCDVISPSLIGYQDYAILKEMQNTNALQLLHQASNQWEVLYFGINPASYDDGYQPWTDRQNLFSDVRTRQALSACIDRQALIEELMFGFGELPKGFLSNAHPLYDAVQEAETVDVLGANALLESIGWRDIDANPMTARVAINIPGVNNYTPLVLEYYYQQSAFRQAVAEKISAMLAACGVQVNLIPLPAAEFFTPGPEGMIFGRKFDLAQFSWNLADALPFALFYSAEIPASENYWVGAAGSGGNIAGYKSAEYDAFYLSYKRTGTNATLQRTSQVSMLDQLLRDQPVLPLFFYPQFLLVKPTISLEQLPAGVTSVLDWVENWKIADICSE